MENEGQNQEYAYNILQHQEDCSRCSSWQAKQSIPHTTLMFYGNRMKM
jgi:hypothetical protein